MNQSAKSALGMMHLLGCAMFARPDVPRQEALTYWKRLLGAVAESGQTDLDPEAFKTTEAGKLLSDAALLRISLQRTQPDPLLPDFVEQYRDWLGDVVFTAAGKQQAFELSEDRD